MFFSPADTTCSRERSLNQGQGHSFRTGQWDIPGMSQTPYAQKTWKDTRVLRGGTDYSLPRGTNVLWDECVVGRVHSPARSGRTFWATGFTSCIVKSFILVDSSFHTLSDALTLRPTS